MMRRTAEALAQWAQTPMNESTSDRLRAARLRAGFRGPAEAAQRFGWNSHTYKSHENGIRGLKSAAAERYARAFHVSMAWLLTGEGASESEWSELIEIYENIPMSRRKDFIEAVRGVAHLLVTALDEPAPRRAAAGR